MANRKQIKAFSNDLNSIIFIKRLTSRQFTQTYAKLVKFIKDVKSGEFDFIQYVKIVILNCLTLKEKETFEERMKELVKMKIAVKDPYIEQKLLGTYYQTIVEYYPEFRVEYVCYDINDILPDSLVIDTILKESKDTDQDFQKKLRDKLTKKITPKKVTSNKYKLSSLEDIESLSKYLKTQVIGQDEAIKSVCNAIKLRAADFSKHVNLFFIGKTGRGKTQLARSLGERFSPNFWVINCSEFTNGHEVSRLLGSPPGYIGHSESSLIKEKADISNKWTIVFDEIEKAHTKFFNILLSLLDTGTVTDNSGNEIDLKDSIFVMTSNCGVGDLKTKFLGFSDKLPDKEGYKDEVMDAMERTFSPEFRGRIDEFVFFNDLTKKNITDIAKLILSKYPIKATKEVINYVVKNGFTEEYGARDIIRAVKTFVALPLADVILSKHVPKNGSCKYDAKILDDKLEIVNTVSF